MAISLLDGDPGSKRLGLTFAVAVLVSVLISSHNYERYLPAAIESALEQTYPSVEVVVVDDGSTDDSAAVVAGYGSDIVGHVKPRGGQASALNEAFRRSRGDIVCLLDADDVFARDKVACVVEAAEQRRDACLIHHQMQITDAAGVPMHSPFPRHVFAGQLRARVTRTGGWYDHAPSSALSFRRHYLEKLFPLPTEPIAVRVPWGCEEVELKPDTYLAAPAAFVGPIGGIQRPLTRYRLHPSNKSRSGATADDANRRRVAQYIAEFAALCGVLSDHFDAHPDLQLDDHLGYQMCRAALGEVSRSALVRQTLSSSGLPPAVRVREALRVASNRGPSSRSRAA